MGYGRYNSSSYSSYGGGGGSYSSSSYGGYSTRGSSMRSSAYVPQTSTSRSFSSHTTDNTTASQTTANKVTTSSQQTAEQQAVAQKPPEQKSSAQKNQKSAAPAAQKNKPADQKGSAAQSSSQKSQKSENAKKGSKQKSTTQKTSTDVSDQKTTSTQQTTEKNTSVEKVSEQKTTSTIVQKSSEVQEVVEEKEQSVAIMFTEGSFQLENMAAKNAKAPAEKTADELKLEKEQQRKETKQKDLHDMELQVTKHPKFLALQEKLNARITARQEANKKNKQGKAASESKIKPPTGHITYGLITIKNTASFLELSLSNEESTLKTLEDIHDLLDKEFVAHNIYKVEAEIGKFLLVSKSLDDMLNLAMKVQIKFNEHQWDDMIINLPMFRKLLRPEDLLNDDAVALFNGPRISIGIHTGEATTEVDNSGKERYGGENIIQVETIGKFAQGGQILVSSGAWTKINQSKLSAHIINRLGVFKLENFSSGCSLVEVAPEILQERTKFYGSICSHCAKGIQPWEKSLEKLDCTFHEDHFKCFNCDETVSEGAYAAYQGLPHCHKCYLASNPKPKCKKCANTISKDYINALGTYWHNKCFACRQCSKRPSASNPLYVYKDAPYCQPCHKKLSSM